MFLSPRRRHGLLLSAALLLPLLVSSLEGPVAAQLGRQGAAALAPEGQAGPTVRVLLGSASRWELGGNSAAESGGLRLLDGRGRLLQELAPSERLVLQAGPAGITLELITPQGSRRPWPPQATELWIEPPAMADAAAGTVALGAARYRGRLQIRSSGSGELQAINHLPLEHYLPSVVGSEMPASWPQAALRAQAVAARTYALSQRRPLSPFDVKATVASQVYRGLAGETASTREAVLATRGQVLMQNGQLIQAVFHSSSGGITEDSGQVWSRQLPYLVSVPDFDQQAPVSRWQVRIEPEQLRQLFREIDGVKRIDVLASSGSGRIRRARVIGPAGALELSGTELRQRLGLRSTLITFQLEPVSSLASSSLQAMARGQGVIDQAVRQAQPQPQRVARTPENAPGEAGAGGAGPTMVVDSATGLRMPVAAATAAALARQRSTPAQGFPLPSLPPPLPPSPAEVAMGRAGTGSAPVLYALVVDGRGFGHGVGMSQWGAHAMALQGRSYEQILRHYYRGVDLRPYRAP